jgi:hypothetical protein
MVVAEIDAGKRRRRRKEEESLAGRHPVEGERLCWRLMRRPVGDVLGWKGRRLWRKMFEMRRRRS